VARSSGRQQQRGILADKRLFQQRQLGQVLDSKPGHEIIRNPFIPKSAAVVRHVAISPPHLGPQLRLDVLSHPCFRPRFPLDVLLPRTFKLGAQPAPGPAPTERGDSELLKPDRAPLVNFIRPAAHSIPRKPCVLRDHDIRFDFTHETLLAA
jgi:hypothetical protein